MLKFRKDLNILSFDGGGTLGVMEMVILEDIMNTATLLKTNPKAIQPFLASDTLFDLSAERESFAQLLSTVEDSIHPTEVFDMIVGTSTGSLISFALVGGNEENGRRAPMTIQEIIQMYKEVTPIIFQQGKFGSFINWVSTKALSMPLIMYGIEGITFALDKVYGETTLSDFQHKCIAGAVARRIDHSDSESYDTLELFDTKSHLRHKVRNVLRASSNAPCFFPTPVPIGNTQYVDGGVGGNCPLAQAIPRLKQIHPNSEFNSALSIAPPLYKIGDIPKNSIRQLLYWASYFPCQMTNGYAVYRDTKEHYNEAIFQRRSPISEDCSKFIMDELDIDAMIESVKVERLTVKTYFQETLFDALVIASRVVEENNSKDFCQIILSIVKWSLNKAHRPENSLNLCKAWLKLCQRNSLNSDEAEYFLGVCHFHLEHFLDAKIHFEQISLTSNIVDPIKIKVNLAECHYHLGELYKAESLLKNLNWVDEEFQAEIVDSKRKALMNLSKVQVSLNRFSEAKNTLAILDSHQFQQSNNETQFLLEKTSCYVDMGLFREAKQIMNSIQINDHRPEDKNEMLEKAHLNALLGYSNVATDDKKGLELIGDNGLELLNGSIKTWESIDRELLSPEIIKAYLYAGECQRYLGYLEKSNEYLEMALKLAVEMYDETRVHLLRAKALAQLGLLYIDQRDFNLAQNTFREALAMLNFILEKPDRFSDSMVWIHQGLAEISLHEKNHKGAKEHIEMAVAISRQVFPEPSEFLYRRLKRVQDAISSIE